jgi:hypothetical protein
MESKREESEIVREVRDQDSRDGEREKGKIARQER